MNDRQRTAIEHPCRFAFETIQRRFAYLIEKGRCSVVLTINNGWE